MAVGKSQKRKQKKRGEKINNTHTLKTRDTNHDCITSKTLEKDDKLRQRSGGETRFPTVCIDGKAGSGQMKMHMSKCEVKGSRAREHHWQPLFYTSTVLWEIME